MAEFLEEASNLESTTVDINRTATTVKGGRRMSFSALVVVGDRRGSVGIGYGKAPGVPAAIEKAQKDARKKLEKVTLRGRTIPHPVLGRFGASSVRLMPAAPGTGVVAGGTVRAVLEMAGVQDCLTKSFGSTNVINLCKAVMAGLGQLHSREEIAALRGVEIDKSVVDEKLELGERYMIKTAGEGGKKAEAPKNTVGQGRGRGPRGRGGPRGGGDSRGPRGGSAPADATNERGGDQQNVGGPNEAVSKDAQVEQPAQEVAQNEAK